MLFTQPILFEDAMRSAKAKAILPTTLSSKELAPLRGDIAQSAMLSARVYEGRLLSDIQKTILDMLTPSESTNLATARTVLKEKLKSYGYTPPEGEQGRITDLSSDQRLNLIVETQTQLARGFGQWKQGQTEAILDLWPAQELYRGEPRIEPRIWPDIWQEAASEHDKKALAAFEATSRFVALKDSPIWVAISDFGLPYPPFKYQSGMKVEDVERDEAIELGLMDEQEKVNPDERSFGEDLEMSAEGLDEGMRSRILDQLGDDFEFRGDVLTRKAA